MRTLPDPRSVDPAEALDLLGEDATVEVTLPDGGRVVYVSEGGSSTFADTLSAAVYYVPATTPNGLADWVAYETDGDDHGAAVRKAAMRGRLAARADLDCETAVPLSVATAGYATTAAYLYVVEDLDVSVVAARMDCDENTVRQHLSAFKTGAVA